MKNVSAHTIGYISNVIYRNNKIDKISKITRVYALIVTAESFIARRSLWTLTFFLKQKWPKVVEIKTKWKCIYSCSQEIPKGPMANAN